MAARSTRWQAACFRSRLAKRRKPCPSPWTGRNPTKSPSVSDARRPPTTARERRWRRPKPALMQPPSRRSCRASPAPSCSDRRFSRPSRSTGHGPMTSPARRLRTVWKRFPNWRRGLSKSNGWSFAPPRRTAHGEAFHRRGAGAAREDWQRPAASIFLPSCPRFRDPRHGQSSVRATSRSSKHSIMSPSWMSE